MMRRFFFHTWTLVLAVPALVASGCGAGNGSDGFGGSAADGTGASSTGTGTGNGGTGGLDFDAGDDDGGMNDGDVCQAEEAQAQKTPLDMILVVDRSGSMVNLGYWTPTVNALGAFFDSPLSAGVNVGLNLFPHPDHGNSCDPGNWNPVFRPTTMPLAILNQDSAMLKQALAQYPSISGLYTPMYGALDGSYQFAVDYQASNPTHKVIVTVAGDGIPEGGYCASFYGSSTYETLAAVADLAGQYFNQNGIETYTVAISPSVVATMNAIAAQGGTGQAYDVSTNINAFAEKLQEIRETALGCEYIIPDPTEQNFDPMKVNVVYTPGGGGDPETLPQADNLADCGTNEGWYYDSPTNPTKILFCPATCDRVQADAEGNVSIRFGCPTEVN